jgi:hypothetical protein
MPIQQNISVWLSTLSCGGRKFRKNGYLDATLSCPFTTNSSYINKFYDQYGVMVFSFGAVPVILASKWFNASRTVLKCIVQAPWYIRNSDLHRDLGIETATDIITNLASSHKKRLHNHINSEVSRLLNVQNIPRRLKRKKQFELVKQ